MARKPAVRACVTRAVVDSFFHAVPYRNGGLPTVRNSLLAVPSNFMGAGLYDSGVLETKGKMRLVYARNTVPCSGDFGCAIYLG